MRHVALAAVATLAVAIVLVILVGEEETTEDAPPAPVTDTGARRPTRTVAPSAPQKPARAKPAELAEIERAITLYVEAAERGGGGVAGLPTTDELSIEDVRITGRSATARAGLATFTLRRSSGRWQVLSVSVAEVQPTPPSNGP